MARVDLYEKNYGDETGYKIFKKNAFGKFNFPEYTLNGKGSCGNMGADSDWG